MFNELDMLVLDFWNSDISNSKIKKATTEIVAINKPKFNLNTTKIMKNIAKAIIEVMKEVKGIEKSMTVGSGNFQYQGVSDYEVKKNYSKAMLANGLCILPIQIDAKTTINTWMETKTYNGNATTKQKQSIFTETNTKYLLLHESGESQVIAGYGHGVDSQDKGAGKSTTYALKYALLYTFLTPTGKIDDSDNTHSEEVPVKPKKPKLPKLPKDRFEKALSCNSKKGIQAALDVFDLTTDQENELLIAKSDAKNE